MSALHRVIITSLAMLFVVVQAPTAAAQSDVPLPPVRSNIDENGVDLLSGKVIFSTSDVSVGPDDARGLTYSRQWIERGWRPTLVPVLSGDSGHPVISFNGASASFTFTGLGWTADSNDGSQFVASPGSATYTSSNGLAIQFVTQDGYSYPNYTTTWGNPTAVTFPNGIKWKFTYRPKMYTETYIDPECTHSCVPEYINYSWKRLSSITSSAGYQLKFTYASNTLTTEEDVGYWTRVSRVTGINNAVESCDPSADSCSLTQTWPHADYAYAPGAADTTTMTDPAGQVWTYLYQSTRELTGIKRPTAAAPAVTYGYTSTNGVGKVTSVTKGGSSWIYSYGTNLTTVTDPASHSRNLAFDPSTFLVSSDQDENGLTTQFAYCQATDANCPLQRLKKTTFPEGDAVSYEYDTRGNITKTTRSPKAGSGLAAIVASATFPPSCSNPKTCNKPVSTTSPLLAVTDYTYDAAHGGLLTLTSPAPTSGAARPQLRYSYTAVTNSVSGDSVYELTGVSTCRTTASCTGTAGETKVAISYSTSNLLQTLQTTSAGDASLTATIALGYDTIGNLITTDGPLPGTGDTARTTYDALRRPTTNVSPDPDGAGPLPNRAVRYGYDSQSRANSVANGTSDSTGSSFSAAQIVTTSFDAADRKVKDVLTASGATLQVRQYSYDAAGRPDCAALRMNSATWGSLPTSACTLATIGSAGPDRITKTSYDNANRPTLMQTAYGTSDQADETTTTYTNNGKTATLTDGQGNKTTYEYDGVDRLVKTRYPDITAGAGTSSTADYEQFVYDANGNVTSIRLRGYAADATKHIDVSYDNLNRVTLKDLPEANSDVSYAYDLFGRPTSVTVPGQGITHSLTYDALGRLTGEGQPFGSMSYQYDLAGNRTVQVWNDGFYVTYDHLVTGEVTAIRENGAASGIGVLASYSYDDLGRRTGITRGNGTTTSYGYDAISRQTSLSQDLASTGYDFSLGFSHNPAGQIAGTTRSNDVYAYGANTNFDRPYTVNGLNQFATVAGGAISYDVRGNLTSAGIASFTYDSQNALRDMTGVATLYYDALGRLSEYDTSVSTRFLYDGSHMAAEIANPSGAVTRRYVFGPGEDEPIVWYEGSGTSDRRWLHADERGSIVAITDGSGAAIGVNSYDEFGVPANGNIGRFQYTGQAFFKERGLYYYKARFYSSRFGRFMQADPIGYSGGMNMYNYVGGDPVNFSDPTGLFCSDGSEGSASQCGARGLDWFPDITVNGHGCFASDGCRIGVIDSEHITVTIPGLGSVEAAPGDILVVGKKEKCQFQWTPNVVATFDVGLFLGYGGGFTLGVDWNTNTGAITAFKSFRAGTGVGYIGGLGIGLSNSSPAEGMSSSTNFALGIGKWGGSVSKPRDEGPVSFSGGLSAGPRAGVELSKTQNFTATSSILSGRDLGCTFK